ncbi:MAG: alpha/beta fold hydrolase [Gammaproteobacteria bacterium]|nr:alpha/beta fold hydrolase [Gammaproteobacteria bacterium]
MTEHPFNLAELYIEQWPGDAELRPVLFLHGNTQNSTCGRGVVDFFRSRGHRVVVWELPGHGLSAMTTERYDLADLVALNNAIIEQYQLTEGLLIGHSIGGMIMASSVCQLALSDAALVMIGSLDQNPIEAVARHQIEDALYLQDSLDNYMAAGDGLFKKQRQYDYFTNRHLDDAFTEIINRRYTQPAANRINLTSLHGYDVRAALTALAPQMLVLHGAKEEVIPKALVDDMVKFYPNAAVEWFSDGGHNAFFQQDERTQEFLQKHYQSLVG